MKTEKEVQNLIDSWITRCISFIEKGGKGEVGKRIKPQDRKEIDACVGEKCPTCSTLMISRKRKSPDNRPNSITVEHIVPRTLGGNNVRDNLVAMCHDCNRCRNTVMTKIIPMYSSLHGRILTSEEHRIIGVFVEWSIRTIHTPMHRIDAKCSELFQQAKLDDMKKPKKKLSADLDMNEKIIELLSEIRDTQKAILERLEKSVFRRFIDWLLTPFKYQKTRPPVSDKKDSLIESITPDSTFRSQFAIHMMENMDDSNKWEAFTTPYDKLISKQPEYNLKALGIKPTEFLMQCPEMEIEIRKKHHWIRKNNLRSSVILEHPSTLNSIEKEEFTTIISPPTISDSESIISKNNIRDTYVSEGPFETIIEQLLFGEGVISLVKLGNKLREYQKENNWEEVGSGAFLVNYGMSKKFGLKNAIIKLMSDKVIITGEPPKLMISLVEEIETTEVKENNEKPVDIVGESKYPLTTNLNNSKSGLKLPREPRVLATILDWYVLNIQKFPNFQNLVDELKNSKIVSLSRAFPIANQIRKAVFPPGKGKSSELDWNEVPHYDAKELCEKMRNVSLGKSEWTFDVEPEFIEAAERYFTQVKEFV